MTHTVNDKRWQGWCDTFLTAPVRPLDGRQTEAFISLSVIEWDPVRLERFNSDQSFKETFPFQVTAAHAKRLGLLASAPLLVLIAGYLASVPGTAVMYVHAMRRVQQKLGTSGQLSIAEFTDAFPWGVPSKEELKRIWLLQKLTKEDVDSGQFGLIDNYLDYVVNA